MIRKLPYLLCLLCFMGVSSQVYTGGSAHSILSSGGFARVRGNIQPQSITSMIDEMIIAVNQLRLVYGLSALRVNPLLMQIAQAQADYNAAIGSSTHYDADGLRPFQRALAVGYPVAGDLSLGGYFSENIINGPITSQAAVMMWTGDEPHLNTMISAHRSDMGVGIATDGDTFYFVLDTGLYSQYEIEWTPSAPGAETKNETTNGQVSLGAAPVTASTPLPDGSILHVVSPGQSLWTIAAVYDLTLDQLYLLNDLKPNQFIYPGDKLWIRTAEPPTPTLTATRKPPPTARPSATLTLEPSPSPSATTTPTRRPTSVIPALNSSNKDSFILVVVICSVIVVGVFYWLIRKAAVISKDQPG